MNTGAFLMPNWLWWGIRKGKDREERKAKVKQNLPHTLQLIAGKCRKTLPALLISLAGAETPRERDLTYHLRDLDPEMCVKSRALWNIAVTDPFLFKLVN